MENAKGGLTIERPHAMLGAGRSAPIDPSVAEAQEVPCGRRVNSLGSLFASGIFLTTIPS